MDPRLTKLSDPRRFRLYGTEGLARVINDGLVDFVKRYSDKARAVMVYPIQSPVRLSIPDGLEDRLVVPTWRIEGSFIDPSWDEEACSRVLCDLCSHIAARTKVTTISVELEGWGKNGTNGRYEFRLRR